MGRKNRYRLPLALTIAILTRDGRIRGIAATGTGGTISLDGHGAEVRIDQPHHRYAVGQVGVDLLVDDRLEEGDLIDFIEESTEFDPLPRSKHSPPNSMRPIQ